MTGRVAKTEQHSGRLRQLEFVGKGTKEEGAEKRVKKELQKSTWEFPHGTSAGY